MDTQDIVGKLNTLADYKAQRDLLSLQKDEQRQAITAARQDKITAVMPPEVLKLLAEIEAETEQYYSDLEAEYAGREEVVNKNYADLEEEIKADVKTHGASVKGEFLHAVWAKGRESVDIKAFAGYVVAHPEAASLIKTGEPTVSIRATK